MENKPKGWHSVGCLTFWCHHNIEDKNTRGLSQYSNATYCNYGPEVWNSGIDWADSKCKYYETGFDKLGIQCLMCLSKVDDIETGPRPKKRPGKLVSYTCPCGFGGSIEVTKGGYLKNDTHKPIDEDDIH